MKTQSSIKVIVQEELESFLLDFGVYLYKSLLVYMPISCNHIIYYVCETERGMMALDRLIM